MASQSTATNLDDGMLADLIGYRLRQAQLRAFQDFSEEMAPFELRPGQMGLLLLIEANPGSNQTALARGLGLDRSTLVAVIDGLEDRGLIAREACPDDRRSHALVLTAEGRKFLDRVKPALERHEERLTAPLNERERATLRDLLGRIAGQ